jgi:2-polyprenyl-3-methyl-5-hydroxy-6-metoxy-1,4-benzoquinol methylase
MPPPATASLRSTNELALSLVREAGRLSGNILDLGAGSGYLSSLLVAAPERAARRSEGVEACDIDGKKFSVPGVNFTECNVNKGLPYADATFDAVCAIEVLEHTAAPYSVLAEIRRVLRPGGVLVFSVPNVGHMLSRLSFLLSGHYYMFRARARSRRTLVALAATSRRWPINIGTTDCGSRVFPKSPCTRTARRRARRALRLFSGRSRNSPPRST